MQKILNWIDDRFPLTALWKSQVSEYYAPKNFNFWYFFGSLALVVLVMQFLTGIFLTMSYKPDAAKAFESVEYIMRDVAGGWFIRYAHSTAYIRKLSAEHGFVVESLESKVIRQEDGNDVAGHIAMLRRS